ncbi:MAG: dihydroorotate dehydrogenase [Candidatus Cloacimonetes bacterium]|jgi:dihydroorotate dehydrogenase (NAD+) catalytic subunit|nr:dihydroorotate dehydrogenase [Candidatus Cloacimonadota bacterium]MCB5286634.1 dihydroorotate dehydrogenase [Candidatus Cloacimonadota bacterium]MCK9183820.1 dihydroorotate dehydrogenase [Candidatus Cloacimonadota bacterium]MCK9584016.1 dihydroorotate dehydrogenase [Candidatus Cloacimonadota bacterium]MDY0228954.1 dihydroorotate dehydrogenase [Candidatus Cloacimonadaceae bacterium]
MGTVVNDNKKTRPNASELLHSKLGVLELKTPLTVASGTFDLESLEFFDPACLGAFVCKTITRQPKKGNPPPRLYETEAGLLNSIGLQNPGLDAFIADKLPVYRESLHIPLIVSISGSSIAEFAEMIESLEACAGISGYEINVSCPNVENEGIAFGISSEIVYKLVLQLSSLTQRELCIKLSPNVSNIAEIAQAAEAGKASSIALINSVYGMAIDYRTGKSRIKKGIAGYTGIGIKPVALALTHKVAQAVDIPILAMGGIYTWQDALEFIWAGASAIALGTANFVNPLAAPELIMGLGEFLLQQELSISEIRGKVKI